MSGVAPRIAINAGPPRERLRRLAVLFKVEIRLKIVAELYIHPMSPTEFYGEFGGGSVSRVAQHFRVLEEHGWLRRLGSKERGNRRGRSETLYRATGLAFFDAESWALLPYSVRLAISWSMCRAIAMELRRGIEAAEFEGCRSRDLTCTLLELDQAGWERVTGQFETHLESTFEEQDDAKIRAARSGEPIFRTGVLQMGFESPIRDNRSAAGLAAGSAEPLIPFPERLAPIFADDLCMKILTELNGSAMSIKQFHRELAADVSEAVIRYRFERLATLAWLSVVDKVKKRGTQERIYRAAKPVIADNEPWADVPDALARTDIWATFERFSGRIKEAIVSGAFDIRDDRHLSWAIVNLDREGWAKVTAGLESLAAFTRDEEKRAKKRIKAGAEPIAMTVGLAAYEAPKHLTKAP